MTNTIALLERARVLCNPPTWYQLGKRLGASQQRMHNYTSGRSAPDNEVAFKLAELLGMDEREVIAYFEEDRAKTQEKKDFWTRRLPRTGAKAAITAATLVFALTANPGTAKANKVNQLFTSYTLRELRRALKRLARLTLPPRSCECET